jgi:hypothetical protein
LEPWRAEEKIRRWDTEEDSCDMFTSIYKKQGPI